jgi:hypothetical protein
MAEFKNSLNCDALDLVFENDDVNTIFTPFTLANQNLIKFNKVMHNNS